MHLYQYLHNVLCILHTTLRLDPGRVAAARAVPGGGAPHLQGGCQLGVARLEQAPGAAAPGGRGE